MEHFSVKKKLLTKKKPKNRVRDVTGSPIGRESHPANLKKQGGKRFLSYFYRWNIISFNETWRDIHGFV